MRDLIRRCLEEDGGLGGDLTSKSIITEDQIARFAFHVRGKGVIAGLAPIAEVADEFGDVSLTALHNDGDAVECEDIAIVEGNLQTILLAERTVLNILCYASGVATQTKRFVDAIVGTSCKICDTRKTTPGLRTLDKYAVVCGGGTSHRFGLHDACLYKDNHLAELDNLKDSLPSAISDVRKKNDVAFVEVEVDTIEQFEQVLQLPVDIVLLDNMPIELLQQAVSLRNEAETSPLLEASGGVTLDSVRAIAETGVDRISIGGLVHQSTWLDIGLDATDA
jgi:nicotinate-nucleotide pyrophosphorylase (carboxylating)